MIFQCQANETGKILNAMKNYSKLPQKNFTKTLSSRKNGKNSRRSKGKSLGGKNEVRGTNDMFVSPTKKHKYRNDRELIKKSLEHLKNKYPNN